MLDMKKVMAGVAVATGSLFGTQALAETTGSLNLTSEYMFRGIESSGGAAVQGSLDWSSPSGIYAGTWASNTSPIFRGNELDLYAGWAGEMASGLGIDLGFVWYAFTEDGEFNVSGVDEDVDYGELYGGLSFGGLSASIYYTNDYFATDEDGIYYTASYTATIKEGLDMTFQIGFNDGDGVEAFIGDEYTDWSITTSKDLGNGWGASFAYVQTDLDFDSAQLGVAGVSYSDDPKFVVSLSKEFEL